MAVRPLYVGPLHRQEMLDWLAWHGLGNQLVRQVSIGPSIVAFDAEVLVQHPVTGNPFVDPARPDEVATTWVFDIPLKGWPGEAPLVA